MSTDRLANDIRQTLTVAIMDRQCESTLYMIISLDRAIIRHPSHLMAWAADRQYAERDWVNYRCSSLYAHRMANLPSIGAPSLCADIITALSMVDDNMVRTDTYHQYLVQRLRDQGCGPA